MTNKEIQKILEFVIKQQEGFAENMLKADARMTRLEGSFVGLFNVVNDTVKSQKELADSQKILVESQTKTDERLNILINTVERYIENSNGGPS